MTTVRRATGNGQRGIVLAFLLGVALPVAAQEEVPGPSPIATVSRWAKWPALGGAVGLTAVALVRNRAADRVYDGLVTLCFGAPDACRLADGDGPVRFTSDDAEALYQETLRIDRSARGWLLAGQVALVASGVMFLVDLIAGDDTPPNIPFPGFQLVADGRRLGLAIGF